MPFPSHHPRRKVNNWSSRPCCSSSRQHKIVINSAARKVRVVIRCSGLVALLFSDSVVCVAVFRLQSLLKQKDEKPEEKSQA
jgi:hypothetical protein